MAACTWSGLSITAAIAPPETAASATWTPKRVRWMRSSPTNRSGWTITSRSQKPASARISGSISSTASAKTGSLISRPWHMPGRCGPWPVKINYWASCSDGSNGLPETAPLLSSPVAKERARAAS